MLLHRTVIRLVHIRQLYKAIHPLIPSHPKQYRAIGAPYSGGGTGIKSPQFSPGLTFLNPSASKRATNVLSVPSRGIPLNFKCAPSPGKIVSFGATLTVSSDLPVRRFTILFGLKSAQPANEQPNKTAAIKRTYTFISLRLINLFPPFLIPSRAPCALVSKHTPERHATIPNAKITKK